MNLYTIGFTKKTAEQFFESLKNNKITLLVSVLPKQTIIVSFLSQTTRQDENVPALPALRGRRRGHVFPPNKKVRPAFVGPDFLPYVWLAV